MFIAPVRSFRQTKRTRNNRSKNKSNSNRGERRDEKKVNEITDVIIGAAISVHKELGSGLLESTYEACLTFELAEKK